MKLNLDKLFVVVTPGGKWSSMSNPDETFTTRAEADAEIERMKGEAKKVPALANVEFSYGVMTLADYIQERADESYTNGARDAAQDESW